MHRNSFAFTSYQDEKLHVTKIILTTNLDEMDCLSLLSLLSLGSIHVEITKAQITCK
jgi:hypothetical protein